MEQNYSEAGYGKYEVAFGDSPAVVVVDFQNAFTDPQYLTGRSELLHAAAKRTERLLAEARSLNIPVIYTVVGYREDPLDVGNWKTEISWIGMDSHAAQVSANLTPAPLDPVIVKKYPSAFFGTELVSMLTLRKIDTVILAGCTTSGCIRASIVDSFSYGFKTFVPSDCVGDQSIEQHEANLFDVKARYANVLTLDELIPLMHQKSEATV